MNIRDCEPRRERETNSIPNERPDLGELGTVRVGGGSYILGSDREEPPARAIPRARGRLSPWHRGIAGEETKASSTHPRTESIWRRAGPSGRGLRVETATSRPTISRPLVPISSSLSLYLVTSGLFDLNLSRSAILLRSTLCLDRLQVERILLAPRFWPGSSRAGFGKPQQ